MAAFQKSNPEKPASPTTETGKQQAFTMRGELQDLSNQVLPNLFLSTLPDEVSSMDYPVTQEGLWPGDASGLIELTGASATLTRSPWRDLRTLFAQPKKANDEINRKTRRLLGQDMVTESWLCVEVLSQLPSKFWASLISMKKEDFTVE
ncbi:Hypothetical protein PHPALM_3262 [Phytophthora palmivora]|uniref:Uncharacterized protein n=1 Tax=Phytophthora palmivora TaxID=4796 RepID=A0A2P4YMV2_9STRA|nr:Hypothetical protein PHPALM_3262 [Phytophthora palmivora]